MELKYTKIEQLKIRYAASRSNDLPSLLLASPQPMSILTYSSWWDRLAEKFDLIAVDLPNHGGSDASREVTTVSQHGDFLAKIFDHFELDELHFVGPDIGTPASLRFMVDRPGRIKSATLGDAGCVGRVEGALLFRLFVYSKLVQWLTIAPGGFIGGRLYCAGANGIGYHNDPAPPEILADYLAGSTNFAKLKGQVGFLASYPNETPRLEREVSSIQTPIQVLHGEHDTFVAASNSERLADLLPNSRFSLVPNAAHYAWEDNAEYYLERVIEFIEEVES